MNLEMILKIIKTVLGKDTDPAEINKPWYLKRRYWGAAIFIGSAMAYKYYGLVLGDDIQTIILNNLEVIYSSISALVSAIGVLYGIFVTARGQIGKTNKLIVAVDTARAECADLKASNITPVTPNITADSVAIVNSPVPVALHPGINAADVKYNLPESPNE